MKLGAVYQLESQLGIVVQAQGCKVKVGLWMVIADVNHCVLK